MKKNYTHISVVLDRSGSMANCLNDTIGGFNQFLKTQKEVEGEATMTLVQFNGQYDMVVDMKPLKDVEELNKGNYSPNGGTALLDAIGRTINNVEAKLVEKSEDEKPEKVIFVIITDGEENESREFTRDQIMTMINNHRNDQKWEFVFIGANQDAIQAGGSMGIRAGNTLNYAVSSQGVNDMYGTLTRSMTSYRTLDIDTKGASEISFFSETEPKDTEQQKSDFLKNPKGPMQNMYARLDTDTK